LIPNGSSLNFVCEPQEDFSPAPQILTRVVFYYLKAILKVSDEFIKKWLEKVKYSLKNPKTLNRI
jgi:hypothetical protein